MSRFLKIFAVVGLIAIASFFLFAYGVVSLIGNIGQMRTDTSVKERRPHITILRIEGPIMSPEAYLRSIRRISENPNNKGVLVRIESPGGAVGASQEVLSALLRLREEKKIPLIVSQGNLAASGGYYISLAGEKIFTNAGTLTGSIGVIFQFVTAQELLNKVGVDMHTIKSGGLKDVGNVSRPPSPRELAYLQEVVDGIQIQFVDDIAANRKIDRDSLLAIADGRILTGRQAVSAGLADTLGGLREATAYLAALTDLAPDPLIVEEPPAKPWWSEFLVAALPWGKTKEAMETKATAGAYFLWP